MKCPPCNGDCNQGDDCPARVCAGKHKYPSLDIANLVTSRKQGAKLEAYKCNHCAYFHVKEAEPIRGEAKRVKQ